MRRFRLLLPLALAIAMAAATVGLGGCAYTSPYRRTALAKSGALPPDHLAVVTFTATEIRPGARSEFFKDTRAVLASLPAREGLLGHSFRFELFGDEAWTITAWRDEAARDAFVRSPDHLAAMRRGRQTAQNLRFVTLRLPLSELPPRWREILPLMAAAAPRTRPGYAPVTNDASQRLHPGDAREVARPACPLASGATAESCP